MDNLLIAVFICLLIAGASSSERAEKTSGVSASSVSRNVQVLKTTRDPEFQRDWQEAQKYMDVLPEVPPGLLLPTGQTVAERIRDGFPADK